MSHYKHIFFDLDHTLWDFRSNSRAVLHALHTDLGLAERDIPVAEFVEVYEEVNDELWGRMEAGRMDKEVLRVLRFRTTLQRFGVKDDALARQFGFEYLERCPKHGLLNPGARELLLDLAPRYRMHIITNGFEEVQRIKLATSGIADLFEQMVSSEQAGIGKPDARIFALAMRKAGAVADTSLMVGDNAVADIGGARGAGIDQVHYTEEGSEQVDCTYRITHFDQLRPVLLG